MTRDDIRKAFPEATDEQISGLLNIHSADIGRARGNATQLQADLDAANQTITQLRATAGENGSFPASPGDVEFLR